MNKQSNKNPEKNHLENENKMGKKKNQRKNSVKMPSYKNTEEMLLSSELADIFGLEAGHTASVDQSIKLLWLYIKVLERRYDHHEHHGLQTNDG